MSSIIRRVSYTLFAVLLFSCSKQEDESQLQLADYVGEYHVEHCCWRGDPDIDINRDGIRESDWLREFKGVPGYVQDWVRGEVALYEDGDGDLSIHTVIPIFVATPIKDDLYCHSIKYYGVEHIAFLHKSGVDKGTIGATVCYASSDKLMYGLEDSTIYFKSPEEYELYAHCSVMDPDDSQVYDGTVHFVFKKR